MDYNEWLLNLYIVNVAPITASEWFHAVMGTIWGVGMAGSFMTILVEFIGKEAIQATGLWI